MRCLTVKIERRLLHLAETETHGERVTIKNARSFPLPENPENGAQTDDPEALARFICEMIKRGRLSTAPAVLLFHSAIVPYHEYYHQKMSSAEMHNRAWTEAESFLPPGMGAHIFESECYDRADTSDNRTSAVFAIEDGFLRSLIKSLKSLGIKTRFASSSLSVWSDTMRRLLNTLLKNDVPVGVNPVCLDVGEDCIRFLFFVNTRLVHRYELAVSDGFSDEDFLDCIDEELRRIILRVGNGEDDASAKPDYILISGERASAPDFADRVAGRLNTPCRSLGLYTEQLRGAVVLGGELTDRKTVYVRALSMAGAIPKKQKKKNLLYGGFRKRRERGIARAACIFFTLAALAAMSAMPVANLCIKQKNAENFAIVSRPIYAEAREKLAAQKQLNALLQSHMAEEAYMQNRNLRYGGLLYQISRSLLADARVEKAEHGNTDNNIKLTFTTPDIDAFLAAEEKMNRDGNLTVEDPVVINRVGPALWRCVITVSWDVPETGGTAK
jgi:hypothetical protein